MTKRREISPEKRAQYAATQRARYASNPELREQRRRYTQEWRRRNPEHADRLAEQMCEKRLNEQGWTIGSKREALDAQGHECAVCGTDLRSLPTKRVHADHDAVTGKPRGVLCQWCNTGIGLFKDDPDRLRAAAEYLEKHSDADAG